MKKKKIYKIALCILGCVVIGAGICYAFYTDSDRAANVVSIGHNDSHIEESFPDPEPIAPGGGTYEKEVTVKNESSVAGYVRVAVNFSDSAIGNAASFVGLDKTNWVYISANESATLGGYYYYKNVLQPGETTQPLFTGIRIGSNLDFTYLDSGDIFDVNVYEETVQQGKFMTYREAWENFIKE